MYGSRLLKWFLKINLFLKKKNLSACFRLLLKHFFLYNNKQDAPVAQLDRALPSGGKGQEFESLQARFLFPISSWKGFSLMEMCIVLILMGVVLSATFSLVRSYRRISKEEVTRLHQQKIMQALCSYFFRRQCLPYPSDSKERIGESYAATVLDDPDNPYCVRYVGTKICGSFDRYAIGIVPFKTLGLPEKVAKDGFGHWITYGVESIMLNLGPNVKPGKFCHDIYHNSPFILIQDRDQVIGPELSKSTRYTPGPSAKEVTLHSDTTNDGIAFVLISHGPSGIEGLSSVRDKSNKLFLSACKKTNSQATKKAIGDKPLTVCSCPAWNDEGVYDDQVAWMRRTELMEKVGIKCPELMFPKFFEQFETLMKDIQDFEKLQILLKKGLEQEAQETRRKTLP
jgi:prepilin-type N-terminal cleavage/methylation domain-containing protein